jgi:FdrA protein
MMLLSQELKKEHGVLDAAIVMGTTLNKDTLLRYGLLTSDGIKAEETDTIISLTCKDEYSLQKAGEKAEILLTQKPGQNKTDFSSIESALRSFADANLATISIPGEYVKDVASKMIEKKFHVFVLSDHVSLEDEISLKRAAVDNELLFMGPEAGTSIINGTVLGFGNKVRRGNVGIIGASGTGIQESSILLHLCGTGITHAIGVGGRDMKKEVGGLMTFQTITGFEGDQGTKTVLLVSKPIDVSIRDKIVDFIKSKSTKDYVLCLIGDNEKLHDTKQIKFAKSIQSAVVKTLKTLDQENYKNNLRKFKKDAQVSIEFPRKLWRSIGPKQKYVRGLFAGGTLCYESKVILEDILGRLFKSLLRPKISSGWECEK